jgi:HEAT repeat protein
LAVVAVGCREQGPLLTHGEPVSYWIAALKQPDPRARKKAVTALGHVGTADAAVLPALIGAVRDRDALVRREAVLTLLNLGPNAQDAVPALTEAQRDKDARVRDYAGKALERVQAGKR